jgi:S-adenosylmethionine uptake transporter
VYLAAALILVPLTSMAGQNTGAHPSIAFLFRAWSMPNVLDLAIMAGLGLIWAGWMYFLSRAYSLSEASVAAPFEYVSLLISVFWGFVLWGEVPTLTTISGAALTLLSGLYIFFRERK